MNNEMRAMIEKDIRQPSADIPYSFLGEEGPDTRWALLKDMYVYGPTLQSVINFMQIRIRIGTPQLMAAIDGPLHEILDLHDKRALYRSVKRALCGRR
jgi:hypothetical protein